jgi:1-acyl-sn-glycerol-3-phosphate acyltransferase
MRSPYAVEESLGARWRRRAVILPATMIGAVLLLALSPLLLSITLVVDLIRRKRFATTRFLLFAGVYLWCATLSLVGLFFSWLVCGTWLGASWDRIYRQTYWFQYHWSRGLYRGGEACFSVRTVLDDSEWPRDSRGPFLVFIRHTSVAETMMPFVMLGHPRNIQLRYVIKRELLAEPALDVAAQRIPNAFVRRSGGDLTKELEQIRKLARDMGPGEGVLIYPEGTRFSPKKHAERLASIQAQSPERYERVRGYSRVLPIRLGGPMALLDERPDADVLFVAHTGFEAVSSFERMINGALVGKLVKVKAWRVPAADIPKDAAARAAWLDAEWAKVDRWVDASLSADDRAESVEPSAEVATAG